MWTQSQGEGNGQFASCRPTEIPTEYRYSVDGMDNEEKTGEMLFWTTKQLLETQIPNDVDSLNSIVPVRPSTSHAHYHLASLG